MNCAPALASTLWQYVEALHPLGSTTRCSAAARTLNPSLQRSRIGAGRVDHHLVRSVVPHLRFGKLGAIEVEHEKPNGR
jgi:hypothetical protein